MSERPTFGPFYRLFSPTQSDDVAYLQLQAGEVWGRTAQNGRDPSVKAYRGELPPGWAGIEFMSFVPPEPTERLEVRWVPKVGSPDSWLDGEYAKLRCVITRIVVSSEVRRR